MLSSSSSLSNAILAIKSFGDTGWDHPVRYFLSPQQQQHYDNYELVQQIQQSVLGDDHYRTGPSLFHHDDRYSRTTPTIRPKERQQQPIESIQYRVVQILILDRKSSSRDFTRVEDMIRLLHNYLYNHTIISNNSQGKIDPAADQTATSLMTTQFRLNVTYIASFSKYTLYQQAYFMHRADIIYSPHGAQLSNLMYIRPCTVSVEFFPRGYYLQFFQSLVVAALGIPFEAYPTATMNYTDKITDTQIMSQHHSGRNMARSTKTNVLLDFFVRTLPQIMNASIQCRAKY